MHQQLERSVNEARLVTKQGRVAVYIPELARADPDSLAAACCDGNGVVTAAGDADVTVTMQSISKVASLGLALSLLGDEQVFSRVGVDPTADPFNSIMRLEMRTPHRPQNPLINAGAIVVLSLLPFGESRDRYQAVLQTVRDLTANQSLQADEAVYLSEKSTSDRNRSLAYFLRSVGSMEGGIEDILDSYFRQCSIACDVSDLAVMGATLAFGGRNPVSGKQVFTTRICIALRALMATCGLYDGSGEFAMRVGVPAKSGVGGGIMAAVPQRMGLAAIGPSLDAKGNSIGGIEVMERLCADLSARVL